MTTENVSIIVSETGTRTVVRNMQDLASSADSATTSINLLQTALKYIGVAALVKEFVDLNDTYINMSNRLQLVTTSAQNLAAVQQALFQVAEQTRTSYESTVTLYSRLALTAGSYGLSQQQMLDMTKNINEAMILSGAGAQQAKAGIQQLSEGFAVGTLQGQHLKALMSDLPAVVKQVADAHHMGTDQLLAYGKAMKGIPMQWFIDAFVQADGINKKFAQTTPTVRQGLTDLNTALIALVGSFNSNSGLSSALGTALDFLANNLVNVTKFLTILGTGMVVFFGPQIIGFAIAQVQRLATAFIELTAAMLANPIGAIVALIAAAGVALVEFGGDIAGVDDKVQDAMSFVQKLGATWAGVVEAIKTAWDDLPQYIAHIFVSIVNGTTQMVEDMVNKIGDALGKLTGVNNSHISLGQVNEADIPGAEAAGKAQAGAFTRGYDNYMKANNIVAANNKLNGNTTPHPPSEAAKTPTTDALQNQLDALLTKIDPTAAATFNYTKAQLTLNKALDAGKISGDQWNTETQKAQVYYNQLKDPIGTVVDLMAREDEATLNTSTNREVALAVLQKETTMRRSLTDVEKDELQAAIAVQDQKKLEASIYDDIAGPLDTYYKQQSALANLLNGDGGLTISTDEYNKKLQAVQYTYLQTSNTAMSGFNRGLLSISKNFSDLGDLIEQSMSDAFKGAEDALVTFVTTGKLNMADLANSIISDLARIAIRQSITAPIAAALGMSAQTNSTGLFGILGGALGGGGTFTGIQGGEIGASVATSGTGLTGWSTGGWTGSGADNGVAGVVHKNEFVMNADAVSRLGVGYLNNLAAGGDPTANTSNAMGSDESSGGGVSMGMTVNITNNANAQVSTKQSTDSNGMPQLDVLVEQISQAQAQKIRKGQGPLVGAIGSGFGISPKPGGG